MRELKFRVWDTWDKNEGKMYYLDLNDWESQAEFVEIDFTSEPIFMQYTGLKDKNGQEIYEKDILRLFNDNDQPLYDIGQVIFEDAVFWVRFKDKRSLELYIDHDMYKVIGNIYENPELLKK